MWRKYFAGACAVLVCSISQQSARAQDIALPGIVVTASPLETSENETFVATTVLGEEELEAGNARSLGDLVYGKPGITSSTFAPGASRPIIRGLDNLRVGITENGIGSHDVSALSEDHGVPIDPLAAQRVEVIRGPATLRYGSQAIGGVVNVINNRIPTSIPNGKYNYLEAESAYSSVDNGKEGSIMFGAGKGNIAIHGDIFKRTGDDYNTPNGKQAGTSFEAEGGSIGTSLVFNRGFIGVSYSGYSSLYYIPGEEASELNTHIDLKQKKFSSKGEYRPRSGFFTNVKYWFGYTDYKHDEIGFEHGHGEHEEEGEHHEEEEGHEEDELEVHATFLLKQYEARTELLHKPVTTALGDMKGAFGFQYGHKDLSVTGEEGRGLIAPNETFNVAAYLFEELKVTDGLKLQVAGRIERVEVDGSAVEFPEGFEFGEDEAPGIEDEFKVSKTYTPYSVSAGALYQFNNGVVARLTGQYVERAPDALELFAKGVHEATGTFEIGDPNLNKEKAHSVEFGLKKAKGRFKFDGSVFYTRFGGYIFKDEEGHEEHEEEEHDHEHELTQIHYAQKDATFYSIELAASYDLARLSNGTFGVDGQYDYVRAKFDEGGNVPRITPQRLGFGVYYRSDKIFARLGALHAFSQKDVAEEETSTDGYTLVNAEFNYKVKLGHGSSVPEMTIGIKGENLLDDDVRNHVSFKKDEVLQPGRNIMLRGKIKLN
ncbi:MAG: TonB-dependent receptor [Methyloligellaceae bacterium]